MSKIGLILLLIAGLIISLVLINQETHLFSKAAVSDAPKEVKITNISDNSFTVSWMTEIAVPGFLRYGLDQNLDKTALDDRDSGAQNSRFTHYITLKNLEPKSVYYFKIGSESFTQTTAPTAVNTPALPQTFEGTILEEGGGIPKEAVVYLEISGGTALSSYISAEGNFLLTLTNMRRIDLSDYLVMQDGQKLELIVKTSPTGEVKQSVSFAEGLPPQKIMIKKPQENQTWSKDLNADGVVNAVDFAIFIKTTLGL